MPETVASTSFTVTEHVAVTAGVRSLTVAVMITLPAATPVTTPFSTVAFVMSLLDHFMVPVPSVGSFVIPKVIVFPTSTSVDAGESTSFVIGLFPSASAPGASDSMMAKAISRDKSFRAECFMIFPSFLTSGNRPGSIRFTSPPYQGIVKWRYPNCIIFASFPLQFGVSPLPASLSFP